MRKQAFNLSDAYSSVKSNPVGQIAHAVGSFTPGVGSVIAGADMFDNLYKGNYASAGLNAVGVGAGLLPGGKPVLESLTKLGPWGARAAKVLPYVSMGTQVAASTVDAAQQMGRPAYQKQLKEQQNMMQDFDQWRKHKQTLQQMSMQPQPTNEPKTAAAPLFSADPVGYAGHHLGNVGHTLGRGAEWVGKKSMSFDDPRGAEIFKSIGQHLHKYPKSYGAAAVVIPSILAARSLLSRGSDEEKQANEARHARLAARKATTRGARQGVNLVAPKDSFAALVAGSRRGGKAKTPVDIAPEMGAPPVVAPEVVAPTAPEPKTYLPAVIPPAAPPPGEHLPAVIPQSTYPLAQFSNHPLVNSAARFGGSWKGKAAIGTALATAALGTYYMGRKKRQAEDVAAEEAMAQT